MSVLIFRRSVIAVERRTGWMRERKKEVVWMDGEEKEKKEERVTSKK
jgi:hypothetical protein